MRRADREVTDQARIDAIIASCHCCRIGLMDGHKAYIVPLNFAYVRANDEQIFYFHGSGQGKKIDLIQKNQYAGFELDTSHQLKMSETACGYSYGFKSVIGSGRITIVSDRTEQKQALQFLMQHYTGKADWKFEEAALRATTVIKLVVQELSCKEHL